MQREEGKQYVASISYGKDSLAMLEAIKILGYPLDRIITAEVWATDTIPADLPPMQEFKEKADKIIFERYGIKVEHFTALRKDGGGQTYEKCFYNVVKNGKRGFAKTNDFWGFPTQKGSWCNSRLKMADIKEANKSCKDAINYIGIACDEPERIERHKIKPNTSMPLVDIGWDESFCREWCEHNDLLSPLYADSDRGGCWFCHNSKIDQLRKLRKEYPKYWELLLKWDLDSPITFKSDGHTVHDLDKRFEYEELGKCPTDRKFRWKMLDNDWGDLWN